MSQLCPDLGLGGLRLPPFSLAGSIAIEDQRLAFLSLLGKVVVVLYGLTAIVLNASYFSYLPVASVAQGGHVKPGLAYDGSTACGAVYATHCTGRTCTELAPDQLLVPSGTVFQGQLYVTTRIDLVTRGAMCAGEVLRGLCVGTVTETETERLSVYSRGIEELEIESQHATRDPWDTGSDEENSEHAVHHCSLEGRFNVGVLKGPCAVGHTYVQPGVSCFQAPCPTEDDAQLRFGIMDEKVDGTCFEGDEFTLGQLLRAADQGVTDPASRLLDDHGSIKQEVRESGATVQAKIKYGNNAAFIAGEAPSERSWYARQEATFWGEAPLHYEYQLRVISRDSFLTARDKRTAVTPWVQAAAGVWRRNETAEARQGISILWSQEGLSGAGDFHALVVHLVAVGGLLGMVAQGVSFLATQKYDYEDAVVTVKRDSKTDKREVRLWDGGECYIPMAGAASGLQSVTPSRSATEGSKVAVVGEDGDDTAAGMAAARGCTTVQPQQSKQGEHSSGSSSNSQKQVVAARGGVSWGGHQSGNSLERQQRNYSNGLWQQQDQHQLDVEANPGPDVDIIRSNSPPAASGPSFLTNGGGGRSRRPIGGVSYDGPYVSPDGSRPPTTTSSGSYGGGVAGRSVPVLTAVAAAPAMSVAAAATVPLDSPARRPNGSGISEEGQVSPSALGVGGYGGVGGERTGAGGGVSGGTGSTDREWYQRHPVERGGAAATAVNGGSDMLLLTSSRIDNPLNNTSGSSPLGGGGGGGILGRAGTRQDYSPVNDEWGTAAAGSMFV